MSGQNQLTGPRRRCRRRAVVAGAGVALVSASGCLGTSGKANADAPSAITLPDDATCDACGMVVAEHPGPTAEIFYADQTPEGHDNPARFDSTWEAYQYDFERENRGWRQMAFYVTDYSSVDYTITEDGGDALISTHPRTEAFAPVTEVTYVVGSEVLAAMGRALVAFTTWGDAESFRAEHGGDLATHDEVTPELIAGLGT